MTLRRRRFRLHGWYAALLFLWAMTYGGWLLFFYVGANASPVPSARVSLFETFVGFAGELWPPRSVTAGAILASFWLPFPLAPFGLTEPDHSELY